MAPTGPKCPRCGNRENVLFQSTRGVGPGGKDQAGVQFFCPSCKLLETAFDPDARVKLEARWNPQTR